jgi:D-sedoheptulose 7-phosphate isomerase
MGMSENKKKMKGTTREICDKLFERFPRLIVCKEQLDSAFFILKECCEKDGKVLVCGNGGSAADSEHIVGELMKGFILKRPISLKDEDKLRKAFPDDWAYLSYNLQGALPAISLVSQVSVCTAYANDVASDMAFAQQVFGYGRSGDVLIGLSTSGNSANVIHAARVAKAMGMKSVGFTGDSGGQLAGLCDVTIKAPSDETFKIQEDHQPIYHALCAMLEDEFFNNGGMR